MIKRFHQDLQRNVYELFIGEYLALREKDVYLTTVLGPCIAVCLADKKAGVVGMNHFMLPGASGGDDARYGLDSMNKLLGDLTRQGANHSDLTARVFGGANVYKVSNNIADSNIAFIEAFLKQQRIPVEASDLGDKCGRRLYFCSSTYTVQLKRFGQNCCPDLVNQNTITFS